LRLLFFFVCLSFLHLTPSHAQSNGLSPLPFQEVNGVETGACLEVSDEVSGTVTGSFGEGATVQVMTDSSAGICAQIGRDISGYTWSPSPCFSSVSSPSVSTCAVVDRFDDNTYKEMSCSDALYLQPPSGLGSLFTVEDDDGNRCGGRGNFGTFTLGGPADVAGATWPEFGPERQSCKITFNGPRPDGLFGPTWVKVTVEAGIAENGGDEPLGCAQALHNTITRNGRSNLYVLRSEIHS